MVVQHYSDPNVYTIHEQQVLEFVSSEVGRAIERKWTEDKLRESEERYRRLVDLSPDAIAVYTDGRIVFVNRAAITLLGAKSPSEVIGKPVVEVIHPDSRRMAEERINLMLSRGEELPLVEEKFVRLDGTPIDVDIAACSFIYEGKKAIQVVVRNITERKKTQEALQRQTSFYQQLFESSPAGIVLVDNNKIVLNANRAFEKMFQYTCGEIGGKHIDDFIVPEALLDEARGLTTFAQQGKTVQKETIRKRKDGTLVNVAFTGYPIFVEKEQVAVYGMYIDITQEKKLEENLRQAQKMESLGTLAGGIAHDFNNLLAIIMGHAALLDQAKTKDQAMKKSIETITKATHRGAGLVRQLLTFARKSDILMESVNVNETITELTKLLHETFPKTITVVTDLESNLPSIIGDTNQIHQLMLNLCINARDAMAGGGTLTLSTRTAGSHSLSNQFPQSITTEYVKITVADTGTGMDEATRGRIFEPFFTTKERGKGTGLGLATVYGIIESHGGFVDVDSNPGQGTTFCIYFPIQEQTAEDFRGKEKIAEEIRGGKETILVIEDEEVLRELLHDILTSSGYTVILAEDGLEGMNVYLQRKDEIDLVVSDIGLPKMGGQEVFYKLKEFDPEVKVLLASGFLDPDMKIKMFEAGARGFIPKPYAPNDVLQKIRNVLD
jgi:PAS domain S-box-containing protein